MRLIGIIMKAINFLSTNAIIVTLLSILTGCSGDYTLNLGKGYYLFRTNSQNHYILKKGYTFYNYAKKEVNFEECLKQNPFTRSNCYALSSSYLIESNISQLGVTDNYIYGLRVKSDDDDIPQELREKVVPLQSIGYFIIDKDKVVAETGLTKDELINRLRSKNIDPSTMVEVDDSINILKAIWK